MKTSEETHWQRFKRKSKSPKEWLKKVYEFLLMNTYGMLSLKCSLN